MPNELFYNSNVTVVTSVIVVRAHVPHSPLRKTWFGFWKDDMFVKVKHRGRVDLHHRWDALRREWLSSYYNKETDRDDAVSAIIGPDDEWCAEAYLSTDYSRLSISNLEAVVLDYLAHLVQRKKFKNLTLLIEALNGSGLRTLDYHTWKEYRIGDIFDVKKGKRRTKANMTDGPTPFVGAIDKNNGHRQYIAAEPNHDAGTITVNYNGSVGEAFYQPEPYWASDDVNVLYPKFDLDELSALFIVAVIRLEQFKYSYGRKWFAERMKESCISLPHENEAVSPAKMIKYMMGVNLSR